MTTTDPSAEETGTGETSPESAPGSDATKGLGGIPIGHYYSPYASTSDVDRAMLAWDAPPAELGGVDLNVEAQLELLHVFGGMQRDLVFPFEAAPDFRFRYDNPYYSYGDADVLSAMIRHLRPERIIEVGSGFSSAVTLDTNERFFSGEIDCTFVDPEPDRLMEVLREDDLKHVNVVHGLVQDVALETFDVLGDRDILFIDSTHVVKAGSDVNHLLFDVLPRLGPGVAVHFHDTFYPFEYPRHWVERDRRAWAEAYALRAFLQYNERFQVAFFSDYLCRCHAAQVRAHVPLMLAGKPGNLWLTRRP